MNVSKTPTGWLFNGATMLPFSFNPQAEIDPIAMHYIDELYDWDQIDGEILSFKQSSAMVSTATHQIRITKDGIYLVHISHPESDYNGIQFIRIKWLDEIYRGTRREPYAAIEHSIDLPYGASRGREVDLIKETFLKTIELLN